MLYVEDPFPTSTATQLMSQASSTAFVYLEKAVEFIDHTFGEGYAKENPVLVGAFIQAAASDFATGATAKAIGGHASVVAILAEAIRESGNDISRVAENVSFVASAADDVTAAIRELREADSSPKTDDA